MWIGKIAGIAVMLVSLSATATQTTQVPIKKLKGTYSWSMRTEQYDEKQTFSQGNTSSIYFGIKLTQNLDTWGELLFKPGFFFASGQGNSRIDDSGPENSFFASEFKASIFAHDDLKLHNGVISQSSIGNSMIVNPLRGYPAMQIEAFDSQRIKWLAQAALPTTYTFSPETEDEEKLPSFFLNKITIDWIDDNRLEWNTSLFNYAYNDLPTGVAESSAEKGNTVDFADGAASFRHRYMGFGASNSITYNYGKTEWSFRSAIAQNNSAPQGLNQGVSNKVSFIRPFNPTRKWGLGLAHFRVEPDIAPGSYAASYRINRVGYELSGQVKFEKSDLTLSSGVELMSPIYASDLIGDRQVFFIKLGSKGDVL